jgi:hypothetical protein
MIRIPAVAFVAPLGMLTPTRDALACGYRGDRGQVELGAVMQARAFPAYSPFDADGCIRLVPEMEHDYYYEVSLVFSVGIERPPDLDGRLAALEASLELHLMPHYVGGARGPQTKQMLVDGIVVPVEIVSRTFLQEPRIGVSWRVRPRFEGVTELPCPRFATFSISALPVAEFLTADCRSGIMIDVASGRLAIQPAQSIAEKLSRELSDILMAEQDGTWASILRHAEAMIALDSNNAFGHAFRARALSELGKQVEAEAARGGGPRRSSPPMPTSASSLETSGRSAVVA